MKNLNECFFKNDRIPIGFRLGFFNFVALALLPLFLFEEPGGSFGLGLCSSQGTRFYYRNNFQSIAMLAGCLVGLLLLETFCAWLLRDHAEPNESRLWLSYLPKALLRSLPVLLIYLAFMALPEAKLMYGASGLLGLCLVFWPGGSPGFLMPQALLRSSPQQSSPAKALGMILSYLAILFALLFISPCPFRPSRSMIFSSQTQANMYTFHNFVETYAMDWSGKVPETLDQLIVEANTPGRVYWKDFPNACTGLSGLGNSFASMPAMTSSLRPDSAQKKIFSEPYQDFAGIRIYHSRLSTPSIGSGLVLYNYVGPRRYYLYGLDKNGKFIQEKGHDFFLTNS